MRQGGLTTRTALLALPILAFACKSPAAPAPVHDTPSARSPSELVSSRADAGSDAESAATAPSTADAGAAEPLAVKLDSASVATARWVLLGSNLVDAATGRRARGVGPGRAYFSSDGERLLVAGSAEVTLGKSSTEADDYHASVRLADPDAGVLLAANGRAALVIDADRNLVIVDATKKTATIVRRGRTADATPYDLLPGPRAISPDARHVTWVDGRTAFVRDLDAEATRSFTEPANDATAAALARGALVAQWGDDVVVRDVETGAEVARKKKAAGFIVGDDGRAVAWDDSGAALQTVGLFDVAARRDGRRVKIEDEPTASPARRRFYGVCGGGRFHFASLQGTSATLKRECSLVDIIHVDFATGATTLESHTPAEDFDDEQAASRACAKARASCPGRPASYAFHWLEQRKRIVFPQLQDGGGRLVVFDVATGRRVAELAGSDAQDYGTDLLVTLNGKTIAGIDALGIGRLWDGATGRVLFEARVR